jgi:hypothetical protein
MTELSQETVVEGAHHALEFDEDTGQRVIAVLIILVTVLAAGTATLERLASTHQAKADRNARIQAVRAVGAEVRLNTTLSEELVLRNTASNLEHLSEDFAGTTTGPGAAHAQSLASAYRDAAREAGQVRAQFFPRFRGADGSFDFDRFYAASWRPRFAAEEWAAAYARERADWAAKRGFYIAVITIFAVSLFLLGLTLTVPIGHRALFLTAGTVFALAGVVLGLVVLARTVAHPSRGAILAYAYAAGVDASEDSQPTEDDLPKYEQVIAATRRATDLRHDYQKAYRLRADNEAHRDFIAAGGPRSSGETLHDYEQAVKHGEDDYFAWVNYAIALFWARRYEDALRANERAMEIESRRPIANVERARYILARDVESGELLSLATRSAEYRRQLARLRTVFFTAPNRSREIAVDGSVQDVDLITRYRPRDEPAARAWLESVLRLAHEVDATRAKESAGPYPRSPARAQVVGLEFSEDGSHLVARVCFSGMAPSDERLYYAYVDGERVATTGPTPWRENGADLPPVQQRFKSFNLGSAPKPGTRVRVEIFVNGRIRAVRTVTGGSRYAATGSPCSSP